MNINMPTSLAGSRYQLGQLVGRGGMAEVHVATDTRLGRTVAVKIMRADFATDSIFLERFRREAHSVAQMNNPNIVNIYDSGEETVTTETGEIENTVELDTLPSWDGLAGANGQLFLTTLDGRVMCFGKK